MGYKIDVTEVMYEQKSLTFYKAMGLFKYLLSGYDLSNNN